jgi:hypothetical protein
MQEPEMYFNISTRIIIEGMFCTDTLDVNGGTAVAWNLSVSHWFIQMIK